MITPNLTRREREVAILVAQGLTNREIAARLFISERTAESHVEQIRGKLGVHSRGQISAWMADNRIEGHREAPPSQPAVSRTAPPTRARDQRRLVYAGAAVVVIASTVAGLALAYSRLSTNSAGPVFVTVAGTGQRAFSGDGNAATASPLVRPIAVALGQGSEIYIAEGNRVREVQANGRIRTVAGTGAAGYGGDGGPAAEAQLNTPQGLAIDSAGRLYIADSLSNRIRRVDPDGTIRSVAGTGEAGYAGDGQRATDARLNLPTGLAIGFGDTLLIADAGNNVIRRLDADGSISTVVGTGEAGYRGDGGPASSALLHAPGGLTFDDEGNLYIADTLNQRVRRVDVNGQIATVVGTGVAAFGGDGGAAIFAELNLATNPLDGMGQAIAVGPTGDVFIADAMNHRLRRLDVKGVLHTVARMKTPMGVAVDAHGNVYVADADDNRVLRIA